MLGRNAPKTTAVFNKLMFNSKTNKQTNNNKQQEQTKNNKQTTH